MIPTHSELLSVMLLESGRCGFSCFGLGGEVDDVCSIEEGSPDQESWRWGREWSDVVLHGRMSGLVRRGVGGIVPPLWG
jgi:hypothetical protein